MKNEDYQHFVCIVAGSDPSKLMGAYDKALTTEPRLVFKHSEAKKLKDSFITVYENALKEELNPSQAEYIKMSIQDLAEMDPEDFYIDMISNDDYIIDEKTGDAYTNKNPDGKWSVYNLGKLFSVPFLTKDGREVFQAKKGDIDWDKIHLNGGDIYERAWEMVMEGDKPKNDYEQTIYDNMANKTSYFEKFETKENYVVSNTAFWGYAFLSEKTGWMDASEESDQFAWMTHFYDVFIKNLDDDTLLTIYECRK